MHMSAGSCQAPILARSTAGLGPDLWRILAPQTWPLRLDSLPPGTALVGGAVRDALLGRLAPRPDLDLVVPGDAVQLARALADQQGGAVVVLDRERSIARLVHRGWTIDLARRIGEELRDDLLRRDYSANAIALPLPGAAADGDVLDPSGGLADLAAGRLRAISEANLLDDPLRLLRGVRLACELGFQLEAVTEHWIRLHHRRITSVAGERVLAELERLARADDGAAGLTLAADSGLLGGWCGGDGPVDAELLAGLGTLTPDAAQARGLTADETAWALPLARLASVLDDQALERLRCSRRRQQAVARLRQGWRQLQTVQGDPDRLPEPERLQLQRRLESHLPALALLLDPRWARSALSRWRDPADPLFHPRPPIDGASLQAHLGLKPGRELGRLLDHLSLERAFGRLVDRGDGNDAESLTEARRWLSSRGDPRHG